MKRKIFNISVVIILIIMLFALTGCGEKDEEENITNNDVAVEKQEEPKVIKKVDETKDLVYDAETLKEEYTNGYSTYTYPAINLDYESVEKINQEIKQMCYDDGLQMLEEYGFIMEGLTDINYKYYINGDILSLVVEDELLSSIYNYGIYNVNIYTGEVVSNEELLKAAGITKEQYEEFSNKVNETELAERKKDSSWEESAKFLLESSSSLEYYDYHTADEFVEAMKKYTSLENAKLYLNENNKICMNYLILEPCGQWFGDNTYNVSMDNPETEIILSKISGESHFVENEGNPDNAGHQTYVGN